METIGVLLDGPLAGRYAYARPDADGVTAGPGGTAPPAASPQAGAGQRADAGPQPGDWVIVPWGKSRRIGLVIDRGPADPAVDGALDPARIRPIEAILSGLPPLAPGWLDFLRFAAGYYHGELAELALGAVPKLLRTVPSKRTRKRADDRLADFDGMAPADVDADADTDAATATVGPTDAATADPVAVAPGQGTAPARGVPARTSVPDLSAAQQAVVAAIVDDAEPGRPWLLHGVTGSGKTEVYLHWFARALAADPASQVMLLVPEIGLTPALLDQLRRRFPGEGIAVLHSDMPDAQRAAHWLAAATGQARIVLGTRLTVLVPLPRLAAIAVDEEHDPSYKQQEGIRYSARDLAVARAARCRCPIVLGSATPSLESWQHARSGRYRLLSLAERVRGGGLPAVRIVPLRGSKTRHGLTDTAIDAIRTTLARSEQALVFLNRRGYAPVLACAACGWLSECDHCDAFRVLHRLEGGASSVSARYRLICHHCGTERPVPRACPGCGNQDLEPLGRGTQRLEEGLTSLFPEARIGRLDRDVARRRGATERFLTSARAGETNLLVGTQMLAKGHDFERLTLVVAIDADAGLFAADFRAPERLFATLMQVAGRGGRHVARRAETLIQTRFPDHPLFGHLVRHDYPGFAAAELEARQGGGLPPFAHQALVLAQGRDMDLVLGFLSKVSEHMHTLEPAPQLTICDPVPMPLAQLRRQSRGQMLVESGARRPLHQALAALGPHLDALVATLRGGLRWQLVVDPAEI